MIDLKKIINSNEKILWEGQPDKKCFMLECIFNSSLIFIIVILFLDYIFLSNGIFRELKSEAQHNIKALFTIIGIIPLPFIMYITGFIVTYLRISKIRYLVTDKAIYLSYGIINLYTRRKPLAELSQINMHKGIIDTICGTGDVILVESFGLNPSYNAFNVNSILSSGTIYILNIKDYEKLFLMLKDLQLDTFSDIMYPNDLRPKENHGYKTNYYKI